MGRSLARNVYVDGVGYGPAFGNAESVPADVAARVTNRRAWGGGGESGGPAPTWAPDPGDSGTPAAPAVGHPPANASKADWVAYAVSQGMAEAEADEHTKAELRALFPEEG